MGIVVDAVAFNNIMFIKQMKKALFKLESRKA